MQEDYIVFNQRLAGYLMQSGFVLKRLEKSKKTNSNKNIFIFNKSEKLMNTIEKFKNSQTTIY